MSADVIPLEILIAVPGVGACTERLAANARSDRRDGSALARADRRALRRSRLRRVRHQQSPRYALHVF